MSKNKNTKGPGRPQVHDPSMPIRAQKFRATDKEWQKFRELLPTDTRDSFLEILLLLQLANTDLVVMHTILRAKESANGAE